MQQPAESVPSPSFAGLLASLARGPAKADSIWDEALADDVATLSYESALRDHARYRPPQDAPASSVPVVQPEAESVHPPPDPPPHHSSCLCGQKLKTASITIRVSQTERDQLLRRAAEAGLSVSAYLRSCTFEAESLRAMVKDTLRQLREASGQPKEPAPGPRRPSPSLRFGWLRRLFVPRRAGGRTTRA